jgi:hypothetical protein
VRRVGAPTTVRCERQRPAYYSLTRQSCLERSALIRMASPHLRVVCITMHVYCTLTLMNGKVLTIAGTPDDVFEGIVDAQKEAGRND